MNVQQAWSAAMNDVRGVAKKDRNDQQRFLFRGIDAVMNAVGPALRAHGVMVIPAAISIESERYATKNGTQMRNATVHMQYTVYGPDGDSMTGSAYGEAADSGDKAISKAQSVAYRTFLLQSMTMPTDEPDPDAVSHERQDPAAQPIDLDALQSEIGACRDLDCLREIYLRLPQGAANFPAASKLVGQAKAHMKNMVARAAENILEKATE